ncbi:hypothetical protein D3C72_1634250 [compost metagenome]
MLQLLHQLRKLRRTRGLAIYSTQPVTQHIAHARHRQGLQRLDRWRAACCLDIHVRQFVQQFCRLRGISSASCQGTGKLRKCLHQCGRHLGADTVAGQVLIGVGRVFHPGDAKRP